MEHMEQGNLAFSIKKEEIQDATIAKCKDLRAALRLCIEISGLERKDVAFQIGILDNHLSRMLAENSEDNRHFPTEKIAFLMDICGNEIPLRWMAMSRGYGLYRLRTALEIENEKLKTELDRERREREVILKAFKEVRP